MQLDTEIHDLEQRLAQRRVKVELLARAAGRRTVRNLVSPVGLLTAGVIGFLAVTTVARKRHAVREPAVKKSVLTSLLGLAASAAFAFIRAQYGSPAQIAETILLKMRKSPAGDSRAAIASLFLGLEHSRLEAVPLEQLVELRAVAVREPGRLGDVASRHAQDAHEVLALESPARFLERSQRLGLLAQRLLHQGRRDDAR